MYAQKSLWAPIAGAAVGLLLLLAPVAITLAAAPSISYSASGNTPFSTITLGGNGFSPGENVSLMFGLNSTIAAADASGNFSGATLQIPNVPSGTYVLLAVGQTSGMVAFNYFWVGSFYPTANPSGWYIAPGSNLTWSGSGWAAGETIHVMQDSTTVATFPADGSGAFSAQGGSTIPYSFSNSVVLYSVHGASSGATVNLFLANPSTWYATPGAPVTWSGGGFGPSEMINVMLGSSTVTSFAADVMGGFSGMGSTTLPFGSSPANFSLIGASSDAAVDTPIMLAGFYPSLSPSSYYAAPGAVISLDGTGFAANELITVNVDGAPTSTMANGLGAFSIPSLQLPSTPNTTLTIGATGGMSGALTSFVMTIGQYFPNITPSTYYAFPGDTITFSGTGLAPGETLTVSGAANGSVAVNSSGAFSGANYILPAPGTATYTFTGSQSGGAWSFPITVAERFAAIWFDNYWGVGGSPLTIFGSGFGSGENVNFSTGTTTFATGAADASGNILHATAMPFAPAGPLTITGMGVTSGASTATATNIAPIYPTLQFGSYAIAPGGSINVIGSGYLPSDPIEVAVDGTVIYGFTADLSGAFNNSGAILPSLPEGLHDITVRGTHSFNTIVITIWVLASP